MDVGRRQAVRAAVVLEGGHHPALRLDRGEPGQARVLNELERGVVRRPGPGPDRSDLLPQPLSGLGAAGVVSLEGGLEQLAVFGGQVGGGFPDQVGELASGGQPGQCRGVLPGLLYLIITRSIEVLPICGPGCRGFESRRSPHVMSDGIEDTVNPHAGHGVSHSRGWFRGKHDRQSLPENWILPGG